MNIVNIMNFVRGIEPRHPERDLLEPVKNQIALNKRYGFENTFLIQYDAIINPAFSELFIKERDEKTELGVWIEIVRPLAESVGIAWRGRPGYDWDWWADPGFLPAYTSVEKEKLIDELMEKFREVFGEYPKTAGSWMLDIYSIRYMREKYHIEAFGICREQLSVDAYNLWGGPYNQPYYPSVNNVLCPAQTAENQLNTPVFRLLGIDPIRGYNESRYSKHPKLKGCATMEPVWSYGKSEGYMRWFFKTYFDNETMGLAYTQIGQENSFGWDSMKDAFPMQYDLVKEYADAGKIQVLKMCDAGKLFRERYNSTPAASIVADSDPIKEHDYRSVLYTSKNYRANLFLDAGKLYFRDIQKFDEKYTERYLNEPCHNWEAVYDNLPVVDERGWSKEKDSHEAGLDFEGSYKFKSASREKDGLIVICEDDSGKEVKVIFDEAEITIIGGGNLIWRFGTFVDYNIKGKNIDFVHNYFAYTVKTEGKLDITEEGLSFKGEERKISFS